jgi:hypothetical protein
VIPVLRTSLAAVLAAGVFAVAGCSSPSGCAAAHGFCPAIAPRVAFIPAINGKSAVLRKDGHVPRYRVRPGEHLVMRIAVTVPEHVRITALWFGISTGTWGRGPAGTPVGMSPVLAHYSRPLSAGSHIFGLDWRIPHRRAAASLYLTYAWSSHQPPASAEGPIATLALPSTSTLTGS